MNPVERGIRLVDRWQQEHRAAAFGFAIFKKFGDDQGLWPRSITQPPLTHADRKLLVESAEAERRRPEQAVSVEFTPQADHDPLEQPPLPGG